MGKTNPYKSGHVWCETGLYLSRSTTIMVDRFFFSIGITWLDNLYTGLRISIGGENLVSFRVRINIGQVRLIKSDFFLVCSLSEWLGSHSVNIIVHHSNQIGEVNQGRIYINQNKTKKGAYYFSWSRLNGNPNNWALIVSFIPQGVKQLYQRDDIDEVWSGDDRIQQVPSPSNPTVR